jgi:hypothetical protein
MLSKQFHVRICSILIRIYSQGLSAAGGELYTDLHRWDQHLWVTVLRFPGCGSPAQVYVIDGVSSHDNHPWD